MLFFGFREPFGFFVCAKNCLQTKKRFRVNHVKDCGSQQHYLMVKAKICTPRRKGQHLQ